MKFTLIICTVLITVSCNKYLDKPGDSTQKVPQTLTDVQLLLDEQIPFGLINIGSDEFFKPSSLTLTGIGAQYYKTWTPNQGTVFLLLNYWKDPYSGVFSANLSFDVLGKIDRTSANSKLYDALKGTAYFQRAFALLSITWQYSKAYNEATAATDPGAVIDLNADAFESLKRSTVAETYAQIIKDAEESLKLLPEFPEHPTRPSQLAAYGLLARVYLSMRKYDKVLEYCNAYLEKQKALLNFNNPAEIDLNAFEPMFAQRYGKEVIYYRQTPAQGSVSVGNHNNYFADSNLVASFSTDDLRRAAWLNPNGNYHKFKGSYAGNRPMTGICTDELFIMRAECFARAGEVQKAMDDLNELLVTRYKTGTFVPLSAATKEEALEIVLRERKKELMFRGLRWMDIKRLNEEGYNISIVRKIGNEMFVLPPKDPRFAMQLPQTLVDNFGYTQNPIE